MFKLKAYSLAFLAFLAYCIFSSKNIIIYNEEILVALTFLAFIFFISHYYGNTIKESLNERKNAIKLELQNLALARQESMDRLLTEYEMLLVLPFFFPYIKLLTRSWLLIGSLKRKKGLPTFFYDQMEQKLKTLSQSKITLQQKLQQFMAANLLGNLHVQFQRSKTEEKYNPFGSFDWKILSR